jgi:hypothetical protein
MGSNVNPNGLYGLLASTAMRSVRLLVWAPGPMVSGSGAAWLTDERLLNAALARALISGESL